MSLIASSVPGRLRLRHTVLRDPAHLQRLRDSAERWPGVWRVEANRRVGSLLVHYDSAELAQGEIEARVNAMVCPVRTHTANLLPAPAAKRSRHARAQASRLTKRGMMASLAASTALAFAKRKYLYLHVATGQAFLVFAAAHVFLYRRSLLR